MMGEHCRPLAVPQERNWRAGTWSGHLAGLQAIPLLPIFAERVKTKANSAILYPPRKYSSLSVMLIGRSDGVDAGFFCNKSFFEQGG